MRRRVIKSAESRSDVIAAARYIADSNKSAALRFASAVEESLQRLLQVPQLGEKLASQNSALRDLRVWPVQKFRNFLVFYAEMPDGIRVIRILHGARDWQAILGG